tara:strand:- start:208 stop:447 length:240 start_codon:yes stop_codon:yes gene_type:complete
MDNTEFRSAKTFLDFYGDSEGSCSFSEHFIDELVDKVDNALDSRILLMKEAEAKGLHPTLQEHGLTATDLVNRYGPSFD